MAQKVKGLGFQLEFADRIRIGNFYKQLQMMNGQEFSHWGTQNFIYTDLVDSIIVGLVLSFKGQRKYMNSIRDAQGRFRVQKQQLREGEHGTEASIFCINPASGKGIFTTHWGGVGASKLKMAFRDVHEDLKTKLIERYVEEGIGRGETRIELRKEARAIFHRKFDMPILCNTDDFEQVIAMYKRVAALRFSAQPGLLDAPWLRPIRDQYANASMTISMKKDSSVGMVLSGVKALFSRQHRDKIKALRIIGTSVDGDELSHLVGGNRFEYFRCDYDEYVDKLPSRHWNDFQSCAALAEIMEAMGENRAVFMRPPANRNWLPRDEYEGISLKYD
jgi:hypothetical protein